MDNNNLYQGNQTNPNPGAAAPGYGQPPQGNAAPGYGQPPQGNAAPGYGQPPQGTAMPNYGQSSQSTAMPVYGMPPERKKASGLAIASLIIGILSMTLCCVGGSVFGLVGLVLGIVALCKKDSKKGMAIGGVVTSCLGIIIGIIAVIWIVTDFDYDDPFEDHSFKVDDGSVIYFDGQNGFSWYDYDYDHTDNYYLGTYKVYRGEDAVDYLDNRQVDYDVTEADLEDYFDSYSDFYTEDNFCILVLDFSEVKLDGERIPGQNYYDAYYAGYYEDGYFDSVNLAFWENWTFTLAD